MSKEQNKMTFGIQPTCWTNDDFAEIGNDYPYQVILDETEEAGFAGGSTGHNYPSHLPSLRQALKVNNLQIASTWAGTSFTTGVDVDAAFAAFQAQVTFLKEVGAKDVVVAELANAVNQIRTKRVLEDRPILAESQWFLLTEYLDQAGKYAKDQDMQLSYHPHVGTCVMTIEETVRLLDSTNPDHVGLCLDTGHLRYGGASQSDLLEFTKKYARRITHVHLKNVRKAVLPVAAKGNYSFYQAIMNGIFTVPGDPDGDDLAPIVEILKQVNYGGWMVIEAEQNPAKANPLHYAKTARAFLRKQLGY
jgi:inosose dehydratase